MSNIAVELVEQGKAHDYYYTGEWVHRQKETMDRYKRECVRCKAVHNNKIERAYILHHVKRLKAAPEIADVEFIEPTQNDRQAAAKSDVVVKQYYNGKAYELICVDADKFYEHYYVKDIDKVIQLLPVCRDCHKIIHQTIRCPRPPKPGSLDERFPEIL